MTTAGREARLLIDPSNGYLLELHYDPEVAQPGGWVGYTNVDRDWDRPVANPLLPVAAAQLATDVAAAPLLWVLPLSLYLLTWVLVFQSRPLLPHKWMLLAQPLAIAGVVVWQAGCNGYYRVPSGRIVTQWPHSMSEYRVRTQRTGTDDFEVGCNSD